MMNNQLEKIYWADLASDIDEDFDTFDNVIIPTILEFISSITKDEMINYKNDIINKARDSEWRNFI